MSTTTFKSKDGLFEFTVKSEFVVQNPAYQEADTIKLLSEEMNLHKYLHNLTGPAWVHLKTIDPKTGKNKIEYWIEGEFVELEKAEKIIHNNKFNEKFDKEILQD